MFRIIAFIISLWACAYLGAFVEAQSHGGLRPDCSTFKES